MSIVNTAEEISTRQQPNDTYLSAKNNIMGEEELRLTWVGRFIITSDEGFKRTRSNSTGRVLTSKSVVRSNGWQANKFLFRTLRRVDLVHLALPLEDNHPEYLVRPLEPLANNSEPVQVNICSFYDTYILFQANLQQADVPLAVNRHLQRFLQQLMGVLVFPPLTQQVQTPPIGLRDYQLQPSKQGTRLSARVYV